MVFQSKLKCVKKIPGSVQKVPLYPELHVQTFGPTQVPRPVHTVAESVDAIELHARMSQRIPM